MRIVIDMQGAQSVGSRHRGIGRYSLALVQAMVRQRSGHEIVLALNGLFPETIEPIRAAFAGLLPAEHIRVWLAPAPLAVQSATEAQNAKATAERVRQAFLHALAPDVVLITSLFEGYADAVAASIEPGSEHATAVVLYDLIPLIHRQIYLANPDVERWYLGRIEQLKHADVLLAISASSGREAVQHIGYDPARVVNISTACDKHFQPQSVSPEAHARLRSQYGVERPYVMYTGGMDHRKNIDGLIRAYATLDAHLRRTHQLLVVCALQPPQREQLLRTAAAAGLEPGELVLTGFVPESDLILFYNACKLFVFPSWHEGFGMPALEAMRCGRAVLGSSSTSLPEVLGRADAMFDPHNLADMAGKMRQALLDDSFRHALERHGLRQAQRFSWAASAHRALAALQRLHEQRLVAATPTVAAPAQHSALAATQRPRLAFVSPLPPQRSGIADYSAALLRELARWYQVEVVVDQPEVTDAWVLQHCPVRDAAWLRAHQHSYERVLYHLGASALHRYMFDLWREVPGVLVLHDFYLSNALADAELSGTLPYTWARALYASHGWGALVERYGAGVDHHALVAAYPCNLAPLQHALGVIVHSQQARTLASTWYGAAAAQAWHTVPLLRAPVEPDLLPALRQQARQELGLRASDVLICSFGFLHPLKLNQRLYQAFASSTLAHDAAVQLAFVGEQHAGDYGQQLRAAIEHSGLAQRVRITGWVDAAAYQRYLLACDMAVQLRTQSRGETSAAVLDCMAYGVATIVNAHGSLAELDPAAVRMLPDAFSDAELVHALHALRTCAQQRAELGHKAMHTLRTQHHPAACAASYARAIECSYQQAQRGLRGVLQHCAALPAPAAGHIEQLAQAVAFSLPPQPRLPQLLVDVSDLLQQGSAASPHPLAPYAVLRSWLLAPCTHWRVEPVYAGPDSPGLRYAQRWCNTVLGLDPGWAGADPPIDAWSGDLYLALRAAPPSAAALQREQSMRSRGLVTLVLALDWHDASAPVPDLLAAAPALLSCLCALGRVAGVAVQVQRATAQRLQRWLHEPATAGALSLGYWQHTQGHASARQPEFEPGGTAASVLQRLLQRPTWVLAGAIELRAGYLSAWQQFERLWQQGHDFNLCLITLPGCTQSALAQRLRHHPQAGERLFACTATPELLRDCAASAPQAGTLDLAQWLARHCAAQPRERQLFVDVTELDIRDAHTGIQRVVKSLLGHWLQHPPAGFRVEPVSATAAHGYRYAHRLTQRLLGGSDEAWADTELVYAAGDVFLGLDLAPYHVPQREAFFAALRAHGVPCYFVVYDLLPVRRPDWWAAGTGANVAAWLRAVARMADGLLCISRSTLDELQQWLQAEQPERTHALPLSHFSLGAELHPPGTRADSALTASTQDAPHGLIEQLGARPSFLMVGTLEPRKGHAQALSAFESLWQSGVDVNLVIVGKQGWLVDALVQKLQQNPELQQRLYWLQGISDEYLEQVYAACTCLLAASEGEGFGLPLIEAAHHGLPIIARDLPVFREVAGAHAYYFSGLQSEALAQAIQAWLALHAQGKVPPSHGLPWLTWEQSAHTLQALLLDPQHPNWLHTWQPAAPAPALHSTTTQPLP